MLAEAPGFAGRAKTPRQDLEGRTQVGGFLRNDETVDPEALDHDADPDWIGTVIQQITAGLGIHIDRGSLIDSWAGLIRPPLTSIRSSTGRRPG
jgi:hypothetical protein